MMDVLLLLRLEHKNFGELLNLIDKQRYNLEQGGNVDINLLQSLAEYLSGYPDECHHPVEDIVLRRLCLRDPGAMPDADRLSKEHGEIERLTGLFATTVTATVNAGDAQTPELGEVMQQLVNYYRNHMMMEEEYFLPAAARVLSKEDWEAIELDLCACDGPLFSRAAHVRFQNLLEEIEKTGRVSGRHAFRLRQAKRVQSLRSMSDFNDSMHEAGVDCLLVRHPGGGYGLELDGLAIMDIPECSEERATWCAYYFLQGRES